MFVNLFTHSFANQDSHSPRFLWQSLCALVNWLPSRECWCISICSHDYCEKSLQPQCDHVQRGQHDETPIQMAIIFLNFHSNIEQIKDEVISCYYFLNSTLSCLWGNWLFARHLIVYGKRSENKNFFINLSSNLRAYHHHRLIAADLSPPTILFLP